MSNHTPQTWAAGVLLAGAISACMGTVGGGDGNGDGAGTSAADGTKPQGGACVGADFGLAGVHRLNRAEYDNTVRDLLGDDSRPAASFPADDGANGFTNNAEALSISPLHYEAFDAAAQKIAAKAMGGAARASIVTCDPAVVGEDACAQQILSALAKRAWRRPVAADELTELVALVGVAKSEGESFARGIELALHAMLVSPNFLFRVETDPDPSSTAPHPVDDYALASRLSYFLWSSMPDAALLSAADGNKLGDPAELERQARRMLEDPKAASLLEEFAGQWLMAPFASAEPAPEQFPAFDAELKSAMREETVHALRRYLLEDKSMLDLLDSDTTWANQRLAEHYGIAGVTGSEFRPISLVGTGRRGLLGQGSILTMTSTATRSSPTRRGNWILTNVLCDAPPPPPNDVPPLPEGNAAQSIREALEQHRKNPACAGCHVKMDPLGLSLEHFDGIGAWRDQDRGKPIDATTTLEDGHGIDGETELAAALKRDPRVPTCATSKLWSFALGRTPRFDDTCRIADLSKKFEASGYRIKELIVTIVKDDSFRLRHGRK